MTEDGEAGRLDIVDEKIARVSCAIVAVLDTRNARGRFYGNVVLFSKVEVVVVWEKSLLGCTGWFMYAEGDAFRRGVR